MADDITRTPLARSDLIAIWDFIAADNEVAADRFLDRIESVLQMLRNHPESGRARPELAAALRSFPVGNYVLFYRPSSEGIVLVRVLNGYKDIQPEVFDT